MPAIQPDRLKEQVAQLTLSYPDTQAYVRKLHDLLESYSDNTRRSGQTAKPAPLTRAYKVATPILRQIQVDVTPLVKEEPLNGLVLCDSLWDEPFLELKLLAGMILGVLPFDDPQPILQRMQIWITPDLEDYLVDNLVKDALAYTRRKNPRSIMELARNWLDDPRTFYQRVGLRLLESTVADVDFKNLPIIFRIIHPLCQSAPAAIRHDLLDVLRTLGKRSPQETAFFLSQTLNLPNSPDTAWLIRQVIGEFPVPIQRNLRSALRGMETENPA